jgi:hypothetical protein
VAALAVYYLIDLAQAEEVRSLSRGAWAVICLVLIPLSGIIYLAVGKAWKSRETPSFAPC